MISMEFEESMDSQINSRSRVLFMLVLNTNVGRQLSRYGHFGNFSFLDFGHRPGVILWLKIFILFIIRSLFLVSYRFWKSKELVVSFS